MTADDLRAWRKRLGYTQRQAAAALGLSLDWVRSVETRRRRIRPAIAMACRYLEDQAPANRPAS